MSMLDNLKKSAPNPVFMDEDDDIDNMDFALPTDNRNAGPSSSRGQPQQSQGMPDMNELQRIMQQLQGGGGGGGGMPDMSAMANMAKSMGMGGMGGMGGMPGMPTPSAAASVPSHVTVASGPNGVQRLIPLNTKSNWVCVYPCYIDADKSVNEGRKVVKEKAVKNPHAYHMAVAVQQLGLTVVYEGKRHPRDWANPGRVRVQLKTKNSNFFINHQITTRKQLFHAIAERLPEARKNNEVPKHVISPMTTLAEVEALADEQRKAQGLPTLAEMNAQAAAQQQPVKPAAPKKQKVKYVRG
ncbi:unnamed protein product [Absidia cylindrospora]